MCEWPEVQINGEHEAQGLVWLCSKWTAFIRLFSNRRPLKVLYNIAQQSPKHTTTAVATMQGDRQLGRSSQGEAFGSGTL